MTRDESRTLCVDLDQTLCASEPPAYESALPIDGAREALQRLRAAGWLVVIHTARHFNHWRTTVDWLARHGFGYDQIVFGKPPARFYIDDRAVAYQGNWREVCERLEQAAGDGSLERTE
jgi:hypothetical protein